MKSAECFVPEEKIEEQKRFMAIISAANRESFEKTAHRKKAYTETYGCQQNAADTEKISGMLETMGFEMVSSAEDADVIVINTCAVREHAEMRVLGNVGALRHKKRRDPGTIIAICGCMVQQEHVKEKIKKSYPYVDMVFGPHALWRFPKLLYDKMSKNGRIFDTEDSSGQIAEGLPAIRKAGPKAWLSIMYGCNNFCSYCIVPYVRGRERSRTKDAIMREFRSLIDKGYRDVTLLGQNVNSYGRDLGGYTDFPDLMREMCEIPGDFWIRFMTSHPKDATIKMFDTMAECEKIERHIHLPFQSGSSRVLQAMNRGYTREDYLGLIEYARKKMPDITITSDVIVGFPGETEEEFEDTLSMIEKVRFSALFTFIYSKRAGTPAAKMDCQIPEDIKHERFDRLIALQNAISEKEHEKLVGSTQRVLVDGKSRGNEWTLSSRTSGGRLVHLKGGERLIGSFAHAKIVKCSPWALFGECV